MREHAFHKKDLFGCVFRGFLIENTKFPYIRVNSIIKFHTQGISIVEFY